MRSKLDKLSALVSILGTMTAVLALCCAAIFRGFDGTPPVGVKYAILAIVCLFALAFLVGLVVHLQRKLRAGPS